MSIAVCGTFLSKGGCVAIFLCVLVTYKTVYKNGKKDLPFHDEKGGKPTMQESNEIEKNSNKNKLKAIIKEVIVFIIIGIIVFYVNRG